jgi:cytochrome c biogenesis protein CcdA
LKLPSRLSFDSKSTVKKFAGIFFMMDNIFIGLFFLGFIFYFLDPCIAPIFIAMIPLLLQEHLSLIILVFSIGAFIPFIGIGLLVGSLSRLVNFTNEHRSKIRAISGLILISYAIYLVLFNLL